MYFRVAIYPHRVLEKKCEQFFACKFIQKDEQSLPERLLADI